MTSPIPGPPSPLRAEVLGLDALERLGERLALEHEVEVRRRAPAPLLHRLEENDRAIRRAYATLTEAVEQGRAISPAAEWIIDNVHVADEQVRAVREGLPSSYLGELPRLTRGEHAGHPRVYALVRACVEHTDSRFDPETLRRFVDAYQRHEPLTMGELWAVAAIYELLLLENLRRIADGILHARRQRARASVLADRLREMPPTDTADALADHEDDALDPDFAAGLVQRLRESEPWSAAVLAWLEGRLARRGLSAEEVVGRVQVEEVATHATVGNVITSMRQIAAHDWAAFFESVSPVERALRDDPAGIYARMDFATRDLYRHAVEELARGAKLPEVEVARRVVEHAATAHDDPSPDADIADHVGYWLVRGGRRKTERNLGYRVPVRAWGKRAFVSGATPGYLGTIGLVTALLMTLVLAYLAGLDISVAALVAIGLFALVPATDLAIAVIHRDLTGLLEPRRLPKLDFSEGVPPEHRTLVAVPAILSSEDEVRELAESLERHFLANPAADLTLALLSDWEDADAESLPGDERLLAAAASALGELGERHGPGPEGTPRFLLLHRRRTWNPAEGRWMGWERKRGKVHELNGFLRGDGDTTILERADGLTDVPPDVRYVIVLDADTRLPPGSAARLAGAMAHPLNRPRFDPARDRVTRGYGVLQPRITPVLPRRGETTPYHRLYAGPTGIDPYSAAVSDVYQDLFGEGSFVGKGIYDVDAFEASLAGRVPENAVLSHDLFEGTFARCGSVTDIELFDDFPSDYVTAARREHRWARGDWQLLPWILGSGPARAARKTRDLPLIARWKMLDNLRRTLSPPSTFLLLVSGWALVPVSPLLWTGFVVVTIVVPAAVPVLVGLVPRHRGIAKRSHARGVGTDALESGARVALEVVFVADRAGRMVDAIVRALVRTYGTRRRMLEWVTAAQALKRAPRDLASAYRALWPPVSLALAAGAIVAGVRPEALPAAAPVIAAWLASPLVALLLSRPLDTHPVRLESGDAASLRRVARRTWAYFEAVIGENGLPPDNLQTDPEPVVARRTSPTNVGAYLLSVLAARDFGWIGTGETAERIERTLETVERLERFHGHLLNWYDTETLEPLRPRYVSTVDSGNLAGHLWTVAEGCREAAVSPLLGPRAVAGVADAVALARRAADRVADELPLSTVTASELEAALARLEADLASTPVTAPEWEVRWASLVGHAGALVDIALAGRAAGAHEGWDELVDRARATQAAVESHGRDLAATDGSLDACPPDRARRLREIAAGADALVEAMDFAFLYDPERKLFPIGYRVEEGGFDTGYYDLLASESRLGSFVAIAKGDVPVEHWFHLGRSVTPVGGDAALVSWSGSMFEYLMPALVLEPPPSTMLERTQRLVVRRQIRYGEERGVPWGISESAYNARDRELTYQYSHFGIPGLGLTRGLVDDLVVAPYATALAAMVDPAAARRNFERLAREGARGPLGFYEALDYTPARVPDGSSVAIVYAYMSHHAGMTIAALDNALNDGIMRRRFHDVPRAAASELLLQERIPRDVGVARPHVEEVRAVRHVREIVPPVVRTFRTPWADKPRAHLLSNGDYTVMFTASGSGFSRRGDREVTRWRADPTCDAYGSWVYLRDTESGDVWSAGFQPTGLEPDRYEAVFSEDRAEIRRVDEAIETTTEIVVSPEDDGELRRVTVKNLGSRTREIELTSYAELALASAGADRAHPAFSKLFVETEYVPAFGALLAHRRPRVADEDEPWAVHVMAVEGQTVGALQYETDRARLLDRGRSVRAPQCVVDGRPLSQTVGPVLDPVFALRRTVRLRSGARARVVFATLLAPDRQAAIDLADKYDEPPMFDRAASLAWTRAQVELQHLGVEAEEARLFQRLAGGLLQSDPELRAPPAELAANLHGQRALWKHGISGDLPIVHVTIDQLRDRDVVRQLFRAHEYWGAKGLAVDVVIVNEHEVSYTEDLQRWLERSVERLQARVGHDTHGGHGDVHLFRADQLAPEEQGVLRAAAAVALRASRGKLAEQLDARETAAAEPPPEPLPRPAGGAITPPRLQLSHFNGLGGFAEQGREYVIVLGEGQWTPAPWVNVIANPDFGFIVSESGAGYTWAINSRENRLTPWSNDPIEDPPGEALYLRDEDTGEVWTPTALPIRGPDPYVCRHGAGYTRFEHRTAGIATELVVFVPREGAVRISRLTVRNESGRRRRLAVTAYVEWVLGAFRETSAPHVVTEVDERTGAILARNRWNDEFGERVAFVDLGGRQRSWTCDRTEFLGRTGALDRPAGMRSGVALSGAVGAGLDPCAALRGPVDLEPGESAEIAFLLGQGADADEARDLVVRYRDSDLEAELDRVTTWWDDVLGAIEVRVPDSPMSILLNRWLLYQALACRVWARSAFYQSGGAYGFRDQLQDVMALTVARREVAREHLLRAAAHQFPEGDVLHWWHPPSGRGVRTRIQDDRLWLPYALAHYLDVTGDTDVLDEEIPFLEGRRLEGDELESYLEPRASGPPATLFEHCARAVDVSLRTGTHGLPIMGTGDWNDGMDRVGRGGRGESVWLGWFLHAVLAGMIPLAEARGEEERVARWRRALEDLRDALEEAGWDGDWYRRAYFDDGTPLGSSSNDECRIDSIAQSWAVMSGGARADRAARSMRAVEQHLVRPGDGLVLLFAPPFDAGTLDPGYIQGYPPGVRENGGQYTHAAIWTVIAKAILGEGDAAAALFSILNPINHASTRAGVHRYKVEPYVAVADVYANPSHVGRGGWTWYTGSAGWMYRAGIEWILGFRLRGGSVHLDPCIPRNWEGYEMLFRYHSARYTVAVANPHGATRGIARVELDGVEVPPIEREDLPPAASVELVDDGREHEIRVVLGSA